MLLAFLGGWMLFHLGIFALSGICAWTWIVLDLSFFVFFWKKEVVQAIPIFTREHLLLSLILISGGLFWFKTAPLAWYDTRVSYAYRFEAVGESGTRYSLPPRFFDPYNHRFTLASFASLVDRPLLPLVWGGVGDRALADTLLQTWTLDEVKTLELEIGTNRYDASQAAVFDDFIQKFIHNLNDQLFSNTHFHLPWLHLLHPPPLFWSFSRANAYNGEEPIMQVYLSLVTALYDGKHYVETPKEAMRRIDIQ